MDLKEKFLICFLLLGYNGKWHRYRDVRSRNIPSSRKPTLLNMKKDQNSEALNGFIIIPAK